MNFYPGVLHSITLWCTVRYRTMLMIAMSLFCLKPCLGMYYGHLELRGLLFNKSLQETGLERHFWATKKVFKTCCQKGCRLKRTRERTGKRTGLSSRRFVRLSKRCTLKRTFIGPEVQKSHFWYKNLNSKHPKVPITSRNIYKQFITLAWQQLTIFDHEWYKGDSLTLFHN